MIKRQDGMDNSTYVEQGFTVTRVNLAKPEPRHLEMLLEGVSVWNRRRELEDFIPNLMGADIYDAFLRSEKLENGQIPLHCINFRRAILYGAKLKNANLESAKLQRANLAQTKLQGANLQYAQLQCSSLVNALLLKTNLLKANLSGAILQGARLNDAHLVDANLEGADLRDGLDYPTELFRANLSMAQPWKAKLFDASEKRNRMLGELQSKVGEVSEVKDLLEVGKLLAKHYSHKDHAIYFRGDSEIFELRPSVLRRAKDTRRSEEGEMLDELISRRPEDFSNLTSALDRWVIARHYGLKTRLLDISRNPLVALFHACFDAEKKPNINTADGRFHIFAVPTEMIKSFDSDTISAITNFARLRVGEQNMLLGKKDVDTGPDDLATPDKHAAVRLRLNHFIRQEKPYFEDRIDPKHLYSVFVVEPRQSFERIRAQSGAFLISAFHEQFEQEQILIWNEDAPVYDYYSLLVRGKAKKEILGELRLLNVTHETLYPGLQSAAESVNRRHSEDDSAPSEKQSVVGRTLRPVVGFLNRLGFNLK